MDKYIVVYSNSTAMEEPTADCNNMDESSRHHVKPKKPDTKEYIPWVYFHEVQAQAKLIYSNRSKNSGYLWEMVLWEDTMEPSGFLETFSV